MSIEHLYPISAPDHKCFYFPDELELLLSDLDPTLPSNLLARLRLETRDQHDAIEQTLMLMDEGVSGSAYCERLEHFYGFYKPVEDRLFGAGSPLENWFKLQPRRKTHLLAADLATLGLPATARLPLCLELPALDTVADYFGCMYVLEGATLGGVMISRHLQKVLGTTPQSGGQFFHGYGERTGAMWHEFRAAMTAYSLVSDDHDAVVASACATFESLQSWCEARQIQVS